VFPGEQIKLFSDHKELCRLATLISATSSRLYEQVKLLNSNIILCPNGVDYDHFEESRSTQSIYQIPHDLQKIIGKGKPIVGYYGALAEWFDYELISTVAEETPDFSFILIGPDYDGSIFRSRLLNMPNVYWLGVREYKELPKYLKMFDIASIPFKLNNLTHSTSPLKLFEYFAANKPVIITAMDESMRYQGSLIAKDKVDYEKKLIEALHLSADIEYLRKIDKIARENTWSIRVEQIISALETQKL
jgi:glycosyltransferase involved in cell wall biosynthesis